MAAQWLATLKQLAGELCVVALPFASADLGSLARVDNARLHRGRIDQSGRHRRLDPRGQERPRYRHPAIGAIDDAGAGVSNRRP